MSQKDVEKSPPPLYKLVWLWLRKGCAKTPEQITDVIFRIKDIAPADLLE